ncbi:zinc-dependent alcohol dehydrogenase [Propionispora vibrioides]|uniref:Threonine dehydrogenase n=1 Tax=Propionispora vibrioides TaxID=112903 RepID=A0A1H8SHC7_9FIRM|nr:alcohol dehydrogenase catalytic domain-containing protein [Propionispora vibrioides]SEO78160.1 Threonine dehydrogenase [Propionispora vibrioides]
MKALVLVGAQNIEIRELATPSPGTGEILLRIRASGICANDIRDYKGNNPYSLPRVGGHEYCGEIVALGDKVDKNQFSIGQHAVSYIIPACRECSYCRQGRENLCEKAPVSKTFYSKDGISGFGGYAQYIAIDTRDVYVLPEDIPFEIGAFTEPLACVLNSIGHGKIEIGDLVVVIGGGVMGLLHIKLAKLRGAKVILSEPDMKRRNLAQMYGCDIAFDPREKDPVDYVKELTGHRGAEVVFNTTAIPAVAEQAIRMTSAAGRCILFSSMHPNTPLQVDGGRIHSQETVITGSVSPTVYSFQQAVKVIAEKMIDFTPLIHKVYPYTSATEAFEEASRPDTLKTILRFD